MKNKKKTLINQGFVCKNIEKINQKCFGAYACKDCVKNCDENCLCECHKNMES